MERCDRFDADLMLFLEDGLTARRRKRLEEHLARCARCRSECAGLREIHRDLLDRTIPEIPPSVRRRIRSIIRPVPRILRRAFAAGLLAAACLTTALLLSFPPDRSVPAYPEPLDSVAPTDAAAQVLMGDSLSGIEAEIDRLDALSATFGDAALTASADAGRRFRSAARSIRSLGADVWYLPSSPVEEDGLEAPSSLRMRAPRGSRLFG